MKKVFSILSVAVMLCTQGVGQNIGINSTGATPNASAMLDVSATDKGMLVPRMTTAQRTAIASPATGLLVFDNTSISFWFYNGTAWVELTSGTTGWKITGNAGIDSATNFIGTLDVAPLRFRVNNQRAGDIDPTYNNLFLGVTAGVNNHAPTATDNTGIGSGALQQNKDGGFNTAVGSQALASATDPVGSTAIGYSALTKTTSGVNTAIGYLSMSSNISGNSNTAMGAEAMALNSSGGQNTAMGELAAYNNTTGSKSTAIGDLALFSNQTGSSNCAVGASALSSNVLGSENTALGASALYSSRGFDNTAVGSASLYNTTTGFDNTALGQQSMSANQTGSYNTALGTVALQLNGVDYNTAVGFAALANSTTGIANTAVGDGALSANSSGAFNTAIGHNAQQFNQGGSHNIAIGDFSGNNSGAPNVSNSIGIGNSDYLNGTSNQVLIGNQETLYIGGIVPWGSPSDARIKKNIKENVKGLDFIMKLRPITYNIDHEAMNRIMGMKPDAKLASLATATPINYSGFLAQEVEIAANQTRYDFGGLKKPQNDHDIYGLSYEQFIGPVVKSIQEQQAMIKLQQQTNTDLEAKLNALMTRLAALEDKTSK